MIFFPPSPFCDCVVIEHFIQMPVTWHLAGLLTFCDPPRDDTKDTVAKCQHYGVPVRMITGNDDIRL